MSARHSVPVTFFVLAVVALGATLIGGGHEGRQSPSRIAAEDDRFADPRYFHPRSGQAPDRLSPADASMQVKGVAAHRYAPIGEVRAVLDQLTIGKGQAPLGRQYIDVRRLNQMLDERWPIK